VVVLNKLEEAIVDPDVWVAMIGAAPEAELLRLDPRFEGVARRLGIPLDTEAKLS
jgi:hypothetical protein